MQKRHRRSFTARSIEGWRLRLGLSISLALATPAVTFSQTAGSSDSTPALPDTSTGGHHDHSAHELNLDLSSSQASMHMHHASPVDIQVGGTVQNGSIVGAVTQTINPGQALTAAQFLAVREVLRGGQTLLLNDLGQAVGGYATISSNRVQNLASLVVPQNVAFNALGFNAGSPLNVSGNVNVLGSLFALQTAPNVVSVLQMGNLNIGSGGLLSGNLPTGMNLGSGIFASAGMTLNVLNSVTNMGTIATPGNLNINAGGSIINQSVGNVAAIMAAQNINLTAGTGQFINSGLIQALGNISFHTANPMTDLNISAIAGTFEASSGAINLREVLFNGSGNTNLSGGDWLSKELNLHSGQGAVDVNVGQVSGTVNATAGVAHVLVDTPQLVLGNAIVAGDPTYVNSGGDIQIVGTVSEAESLAIVASGSITASGAAQIVNHGHDVWLVAGANVDVVSGSCSGCGSAGSLTLPPGTTQVSGGYVQVSTAGGAGGNIDLQTGNTLTAGNTVIDTSATSPGSAGGKVTLVAIANGATGGQILFPTSAGVASINTSGSGSGANGDVKVVAGASSGQAVSIGSVVANGGSGTASNVLIAAAQAEFSGGAGGCGSCVSFDSTGNATGGIAAMTPVTSSITAGSINAGTLSISSGGQVDLGPTVVTGSSVQVSAGGQLYLSMLTTSGATVQLAGRGVYALGPIGSTSDSTTITAGRDGIGGSGVISAGHLVLQATNGPIQSRTAVTNSLDVIVVCGPAATTAGTINIINTGDLPSFHASSTGRPYGSIVLNNTGDVTLGGNVIGTSDIDISLDPASTLTVPSGYQIKAPGSIRIAADSMVIAGTKPIDAGQDLWIWPVTPTSAINLGGGVGGLSLSVSQLMSIDADRLRIGMYAGPSTTIGTISLNSSLNLSSKYGLNLTGGAFYANGNTLTIGNRCDELTISSTTGSGPVQLGPISSVGGASPVFVGGGSIQLNGSIVSNSIYLQAAQSISGTGTLTAGFLRLHSGYGSIGPVNTAIAGSLEALAPMGNIDITNVGAVAFTAFAGGTVSLRNTGNLTLRWSSWFDGFDPEPPAARGSGYAVYGADGVSLSVNTGGQLMFQGQRILTTNGPISLTANQYDATVGTNAINAGTGTFSLKPATTNMPINLAGGSSGLVVTAAQLQDITAGAIVLGSADSVGGITLLGDLDVSSKYNLQLLQGPTGSISTVGHVLTVGDRSLEISTGGLVHLGTVRAGNSAQLSGAAITIDSLVNTAASVLNLQTATSDLAVSISGSARISNSGVLTISGSAMGDNLTVACDQELIVASTLTSDGVLRLESNEITVSSGATVRGGTVVMVGTTENGVAGNQMLVTNSGVVQATSSNTTITGALGQDVTLAGTSGVFEVSTGHFVGINARSNASSRGASLLLNSGDLSFAVGQGTAPGAGVVLSASGNSSSSVVIAPGANYDFPNDFTFVEICSDTILGNPSELKLHTVDHVNPHSSLGMYFFSVPGTIANGFGDVDLGQVSTLYHPGSDISIIAAGNIINTSNTSLTVNLSGGTSAGGRLTMLAGFEFNPIGAIVGPIAESFSLLGRSATGGSILLADVGINTSGGVGGGSVMVVASSGSQSNGSISLGSITTSAGVGIGGAVTLIGNGVSVGAINTTATSLTNSGAVSVVSTSTVGLSNPGGMQIANGVLTGGTITAGPGNAAISLSNAINAGRSSVSLEGASIVCAGLIMARDLAVAVNGGTSGSLLSAVDHGIALTASGATGSVSITNSGNLADFRAVATGANGSIALYNSGNVAIQGGAISAPGGVTISLNGGSTLTNNGFQILSNSQITLIMDSFDLTGANPVNAGGGSVSIIPATPDIAINLVTPGSGMNFSAARLASITAGTLIFGSATTVGGINLSGTLDISNLANLELRQGAAATVVCNGNAFVVGAKSLTIDVGGNLVLGPVVTSGANVRITAASVELTGVFGSAGDRTTITATGVRGHIGSVQPVVAQDLTLAALDGFIANLDSQQSLVPLVTAVNGSLAVSSQSENTNSHIDIVNTGNLASFSATSLGRQSGRISLVNTGNVTLGGNVVGEHYYDGADITISLSAGSTLTIDNGHKITAVDSYVNLTTDHLVLGPVASGDYNISGFRVTIAPTSVQTAINLGGGSGGLDFTTAGLASVVSTIHDVTIGSYESRGGINVFGSLNAPDVLFRQRDGGFNAQGNAVVARMIDALGGVVELGAGSVVDTIYGGSVVLDGAVAARAVTAVQGSITAAGPITGVFSLRAFGGNVGSSQNPIHTVATDLSAVSFGGNVDIVNTGNVRFSASSDSGYVSLRNTGNIRFMGGEYSGVGNGSGVSFGYYSVYGPQGVVIEQDGASNVLGEPLPIRSVNAPITLIVNSFNSPNSYTYQGLLTAGTGTVTIAPSNSSVPITLGAGSGGINLNDYVLGDIVAGKLVVGSSANNGGVTINGPQNFSTRYDLQIVQGATGSFISNDTITMGSKSLSVTVGGAASLSAINASGQVRVIAGSIVVNGALGDPSNLTLISTAGGISGAGHVTAAALIYGVAGGGINLNVNGYDIVGTPEDGGTFGGFVTRAFGAYLPRNYELGSTSGAAVANPFATVVSAGISMPVDQPESSSPALSSYGVFSQHALTGGVSLNNIDVDGANISVSLTEARRTAGNTQFESTESGTRVVVGQRTAELQVLKTASGPPKLVGRSVSAEGRQIVQLFASPDAVFSLGREGALQLSNGEILFNALERLQVTTESADIHLERGAIAAIRHDRNRTYVRVCSGNGTVSASINGKQLALNSGEELLVTDHNPAASEIHPGDRLGRRNARVTKFGNKYIAISDFSIVSMVTNHESLSGLHKSSSGSDRRLLERLLKVAATVDLVCKYRGAYEAR